MRKGWIDIALQHPSDGQQVWILYWPYYLPVQATWQDGTQSYKTVASLEIPWYLTTQWRAI